MRVFLGTMCAVVVTLAGVGCGGDAATEPEVGPNLRAGNQQIYEAEVLPLAPGNFPWSWAADVNAKGQIAGAAAFGDITHVRAVRWDPGARPVDLGTLPGDVASLAMGISRAGDVVGISEGPTSEYGFTPLRAVRWPAAGGIQDLGPAWSESERAIAINEGGDVAWVPGSADELRLLHGGQLARTALPVEAIALSGQRLAVNGHDAVAFGAFVWSAQAGWKVRNSAYSDPGTVLLTGINDQDEAVAEDCQGECVRGALYPANGAPVALGSDFVPEAVNRSGVIAGWLPFVAARIRYPDGTIDDLPLPSGTSAQFAFPFQINNRGTIVGYSAGDASTLATVWRPVGGSGSRNVGPLARVTARGTEAQATRSAWCAKAPRVLARAARCG